MATNTVTTEQVHEAIEQFAAMVAAASVSPQTVANILEMLRNLNDQEKDTIVAIAEGFIQRIRNIGIISEVTQDDSQEIRIEANNGTIVVKIDANGADFVSLKKNGQIVATENQIPSVPSLDTNIGNQPSNSHTPSTKAVKDYVDAHGVGGLPISSEATPSEDEEMSFTDDAESQTYAKVGRYGIKSPAYLDMEGNNVIPNYPINEATTPISIQEIRFEKDDGTLVGKINENGADFINIKINGVPISNGSSRVLIVDKNGGGNHTTIQAAVSAAQDNANNPWTILVYPGTYEEEVDMRSHPNLSLVGVNRESCILKATDGRYGHDPLSYAGIGLIANLTIISTHDDYGDNPDSEVIPNLKNYCIHVDNQPVASRIDGILTIQNCYLYCEQGSALGMGGRANQHIKVINCDVVVDVPSWNVRKAFGGIYMHSYDGLVDGQKLTLVGNVVRTNTNVGITVVIGGDNRNPIYLEAYNNVSYSSVNGHTANVTATLAESSIGNSASQLNYSTT